MRVILDMVLNHGSTDHFLAPIDHDYWFHHEPRDKDNAWGPQFNYRHRDDRLDLCPALDYITSAIRHWVREYHIDGIRYDAARQIEWVDVMHTFSDTARKAAGPKSFINAAEYLPPNVDLVKAGAMDATWYDTLWHAVKEALDTATPEETENLRVALDGSRAGFTDCTQIVNYTANHDKARLFHVLAEQAHAFGDAAFRRACCAATLLMTAVGLPMIWMGEEFGEYKPFKADPDPINWDLLANDDNSRLRERYQKLIALRHSHDALCSNPITFFHDDRERAVLAYGRWTNGGNRLVVVANLHDEARGGYVVDHMPTDGPWIDAIGESSHEVKDGKLTLDLAGWDARVLVWKG